MSELLLPATSISSKCLMRVNLEKIFITDSMFSPLVCHLCASVRWISCPSPSDFWRAMGQTVPKGERVLEVNPDHPLIKRMQGLFAADAKSDRLKEYVELLFDQALLLEGDRPRDPVAFSRSLSKLMAEVAGG